MEKLRVTYWNDEGEPQDDVVTAEDADDAIAQVGGRGHMVSSLGPFQEAAHEEAVEHPDAPVVESE